MHVELQAVERGNTGCVLAAVLQQKERIIEALIYRFIGEKSDYAAHGCSNLAEGKNEKGKLQKFRMRKAALTLVRSGFVRETCMVLRLTALQGRYARDVARMSESHFGR